MRGHKGKHPIATQNVSKETPQMNVLAKPSRRQRGSILIASLVACCALIAATFAAAPAQAAFGLNGFDVTFENEDGTPVTQAGSHPYAVTTRFGVNATEEGFFFSIDGQITDVILEQAPGFVGDATAMPRCSNADFAAEGAAGALGTVANRSACPDETVLGIQAANLEGPDLFWASGPVYNLIPPPGAAAKLGFVVLGVRITVNVGVKQSGENNVTASVINAPEIVRVFGSVVQLWGVPGDPGHDPFRGKCASQLYFTFGEKFDEFEAPGFEGLASCPTNAPEAPFLTLPTECIGPVATNYETDSWDEPGKWLSGSSVSHDDAVPSNPQGFSGCGRLGFSPTVESKATADSAESGSGLDFTVGFEDEGLKSPVGLAESHARKAEIFLPEGMTINPSIGEGLGVCSPADLQRETIDSVPGTGCPNPSKIGSLQVETPLVGEAIEGDIFLAQQDDPGTTTPGAENPFDSLIALYFVIRNQDLGVLVKQPVKVEPDPVTGQLVATLDDIPQFPFSRFTAHLREGQRAALVTPAACGTYTTESRLTPRSDPSNPRTILSSFQITRGVGGGPCPPGGVPPFKPGFEAGSLNNNAGSFSPFNMRLIRSDGEQDMTKFSSVLPPGVLGSLAGVSKCSDSAAEAAKAKTGREELASPTCPANSLIGHTLAGAGVGSALTYVKGQVYLGGPYKGAPLSVISVTPAVAGPFDAGTVVVRLGLDLNPKTAEVEVDGAASDPIPHILKGIVLKVRDLRVYVDRPNFTLNPTSCDESSARATLFGSYLDVFSPSDDVPTDLSTRYQAANCLNLGFKPKLALNLKGGTRRGGHPGLSAIYTPRPGDANVEGLVVRLPRSAFLDQAHIKTICTRVQFAAGACPKNAQYGFIRAWTPLLEEPLAGPVWLRSSNHKLPDLVFDLHGLVDVEVSTRIDSAKGGIRATVEDSPDAPLSKVVLRMQGGKKGLIVNSRNLCGAKSRANVQFSGHNGKEFKANPVMRAQCDGKGKGKR